MSITPYKPLYISKMETGLVQNRQEFILPNDAYPVLENTYVWREQIRRKSGTTLLGRLRREIAGQALGNTDGAGGLVGAITMPEATGQIAPTTVVITVGATMFTDPAGDGILVGGTGGTINYISGAFSITGAPAATPATATFYYFPGLPVMGLLSREIDNTNNENTIGFDTVYAYNFAGGAWSEFIPGTTWTGNNSDFFWPTNYYTDNTVSRSRIFWVTNFSGPGGDPIRYTDGTTWVDFAPGINGPAGGPSTEFLHQSLILLPFRSRLLAINTFEGTTLPNSEPFPQRIRWAAIGTPFTVAAGISVDVNVDGWNSTIPGQGGFIDIPTSEAIITAGFVRDNLVIYCERSTWQLRYTGRSIQPFSVERVNSELGAESTFSAIQFDTSLVGIGDKGVVECDSFSSKRIDIKIPDLVFSFQNKNNGLKRVNGIRNFEERLAYWTYVTQSEDDDPSEVFPNRRLVYNYENDSWAIFIDSFTCFGNYQPQSDRTWANTPIPWTDCNFPWVSRPAQVLEIVAGNQQGFVSLVDQQVSNEQSLFISDITPNVTAPTLVTSPNHNMPSNTVIEIRDIPLGTPFASSLNNPKIGVITAATQAVNCQISSADHSLVVGDPILIQNVVGMTELNGNVYSVVTVVDANNVTLNVDSTAFTPYISGGDWTGQFENVFSISIDPTVPSANTFLLYKYDPLSGEFSTPQTDPAYADPYVGFGQIIIRDNFRVVSKKFNFLDQGKNVQLGYIDVLTNNTSNGSITLNMYLNYFDDNSVVPTSDPFFNTILPTTTTSSGITPDKNMRRIYCSVQGAFLTVEWTLSNAQMVANAQSSDVQIDAQVMWMRPAGRLQTGRF